MKSIPFLLSLFAIPALAQITAWQNPNNPADIRLAKPASVPVVDGVSRPWVPVQAEWVETVTTNSRPAYHAEIRIRQISTNYVPAQVLANLPPVARVMAVQAAIDDAGAAEDGVRLLFWQGAAEKAGGGPLDALYLHPFSFTTNRTLKVIEQ